MSIKLEIKTNKCVKNPNYSIFRKQYVFDNTVFQ